uniref:Floricaula/leafy-like transcription factor n=1 Tax=Peperomia sp. HBG70537 TaxID=111562 RepID=Q9LLY7_9MAGN|nr:PepspLFY protein [Peperomia sp. HBG70537]
MDPDAFSSFFKWDPRSVAATTAPTNHPPLPRLMPSDAVVPASFRARELEGLQDFFSGYGVRLFTAAKLAEMGFTVSTLMDMKDEEIDDVTATLAQVFRCDLLVGERYGIKCAVRAERRRLEEEEAARRRQIVPLVGDGCALDALSQEGLSEEPMQEAAASGGDGTYGPVAGNADKKKQRVRRRRKSVKSNCSGGGDQSNDEDGDGGGACELRSREHPFIVTEPGEVARGKKNGLDYLFHLFEQCRQYLIQVQNIAKDKGEKCPTKVTNQVFRYAKKVGASYINKPKMRHYVHCYALHCLDEETSNAMRRAYKERGENVGSWRQACYKPLVAMAAGQGWDIDALFNGDPRLRIWYVPTKLRQLCHAERGLASTPALLGLPF